jgi:hypothetical protein
VSLVFPGDLASLNDTAQQSMKNSINDSLRREGVQANTILGISLIAGSIVAEVTLVDQSAASAATQAANSGKVTADINGVSVIAAIRTTTTTQTPTTTTVAQAESASSSNSVAGGAIAGIVIGCLAAVVLVVVIVVVLSRKEGGVYEVDEDKHPEEIVEDIFVDDGDHYVRSERPMQSFSN